MNSRLPMLTATVCAVLLTPFVGATTHQDQTEGKLPVQDAVVQFGHPVHPQPPAPDHHILDPNDVTIFKGGTVTFTMNGTGHGIAIYPVSKNTTRAHIAEDLCQGGAGSQSPDPATCNVANATAALPYTITDGDGRVVIDIAEFPTQRQVDSTPGPAVLGGRPSGRVADRLDRHDARQSGEVSIRGRRQVPGHLHQPRPLDQRLDVWIRERGDREEQVESSSQLPASRFQLSIQLAPRFVPFTGLATVEGC